jgi:hypothetical protein
MLFDKENENEQASPFLMFTFKGAFDQTKENEFVHKNLRYSFTVQLYCPLRTLLEMNVQYPVPYLLY